MPTSSLLALVLERAVRGDLGAANDCMSLIVDSDRSQVWTRAAHALMEVAATHIKGVGAPGAEQWYDVWDSAMRWLAFSDFKTYMEYVELDRPRNERFWWPRRRALAKAATALQRVEDGQLDELFLQMPPRVGKTTLVTFWESWHCGRNPQSSNLYTSYSDTVTKAFFKGFTEIVGDPLTYRWGMVFPTAPVVGTDARANTVNLQRKKRYASLTCRSIDGTLNGACDASGGMIGDDLCSGIEEATNPDRMRKLNSKVANDWMSRRKGSAPIVWVGTRWSLLDPIGKRMETLQSDDAFKGVRWKCVSLPALDDRDRSNFDMPYGVGFTTADYHRTRAQFENQGEIPSWLAMYQQQPVERQGAVFEPSRMRAFVGDAPEGRRTFMAVDPAFGGGDYTAAPVCVDTGEDVYVPDVVFSDKEKDVTMPLIADAIERWHVQQVQFEANRMLGSYVDEFRDYVRKRGIRVTITSQPADNTRSKAERIHGCAPDIRQHFVFLSESQQPHAYRMFMRQVYAFTDRGKVKHDDAPDSLAQASSMIYRFSNDRPFSFVRPF